MAPITNINNLNEIVEAEDGLNPITTGESGIDPITLSNLKSRETHLLNLLQSVRQRKLSLLKGRPLRIGVLGFGRFGQFIAKTFTKYGSVVGISRGDYSNEAKVRIGSSWCGGQ